MQFGADPTGADLESLSEPEDLALKPDLESLPAARSPASSSTLKDLVAEPAAEAAVPSSPTLENLTLTDLFADSEQKIEAESRDESAESMTSTDLFGDFAAEPTERTGEAEALPASTVDSATDWFAAVGSDAAPEPTAEHQPNDTVEHSEEHQSATGVIETDFRPEAVPPDESAVDAAVAVATDNPDFFAAFDPVLEQPADELLVVSELATSAVEAAPEMAEPAAAATQAVLLTAVPAAETASDELDAAVLAQLDQLLAEPPLSESEPASDHWFLGVDIGTTGISAVLLNRQRCRLYPLYWQASAAEFAARKQFRLSTAVTLLTDQPRAFPLPTVRVEPSPNATLQTVANWKPYLKLAVPHYSPQTSGWEPALQWTDQQTLPLRTLQEVLQQLLATLNPARASFMPELTCGALGLEPEEFQAVLGQLQAVVVGYPNNWPDTYSWNVREAILQAELVPSPTQIVFLEEAIAALLSALPATDRRPIALAQAQGQSGHLHNADWQGVTLILTAGTIVTELVMVNLPAQLQALNPTDFYTRSLPLAGYSLDQDIIGQLLYPVLRSVQASTWSDDLTENSAELTPDLMLEQWQPDFDLAQIELETSDFPAAAELALTQRLRLQQQLSQTVSGQTLLNLAHALKITLQFQPRFVVQWKTAKLVFERQMLTSQVLLPYVQRLNRELNALLAQTNTTAAAVKQVLCTGGTASLGAITRWLRQKLPNATIVQDTYPQPVSLTQSCIPSCSRVAYGLAALPLHPQVIDQSRHRFSDYLLLKALLNVLPTQPTPVSTIMQLLEQQGIDTQTCRFRILALLEGHLPPGLIPAEADLALLTSESANNPDYQAIRLAPLLLKHADRTYEPNSHVWAYLQQYLNTLLDDTEQTLDQPLQPALTSLTQLSQIGQ